MPGAQDVDTVRATYFAGQAAMIVWSTFLLDELAGLRNDALPSCPECAGDPRFLAGQHRHRHRPAGPGRRRGPPSSARSARGPSRWTPTSDSAKRFVQFMLSDGYVDWLAIAPEGKFPVRRGPAAGSTEYVDTWKTLPVGVDTEAPLAEVYGPEVLSRAGGRPGGVHPVGHHPGPGRPDRRLAR